MYHKVLVPLDGSQLAECSLDHVKTLTKEGFAVELTLLNVVQADIPWAQLKDRNVHLDLIREPLFAHSKAYLDEVRARLAAEGIKAQTVSIEGNRPGETIADYARDHKMNLVVIATHGYTGFRKLMLGSVVTQVLHECHVPVLLVRPESCRI